MLSTALAASAQAASLVLTPDKATYTVGETITLTLVADPMGESGKSMFARVLYDAGLTDTVSASQSPQLTQFGASTWTQGVLNTADGSAELLNQVCCLSPDTPQGGTVSTATLVAEATGLVDVTFDLTGSLPLDYFGVTDPAGTSFVIVPEPGVAALVALGVAGLAAGARRRA